MEGEIDLSEKQMVVFGIGKEEFGVDIMQIQEIVRMQEITQIPDMSNCIKGVINLRGRVIPLMDLRERFGFDEKPVDDMTRILVVGIDEDTFGIIVDNVSEVLRLDDEHQENIPQVFSGIDKEYMLGIGKIEDRLIVLLDVEKILMFAD